jgi:DNA-binding CsgD family transcriptional regulator
MALSDFQEMNENYTGKFKQKIMRTCAPLFQTFGLNFFFHQSVNQNGLYYAICNNPEYMHYYYQQKMQECNPFIMQSEKVNGGVYLLKSVESNLSEEFQLTFQIARDRYNVHHSLLIVENDSYDCHQYGFGFAPDSIGSESLILNELPLLKVFIKYFHEEMADALNGLKANPVRIRPNKEYLKNNLLPDMQLDHLKRMSLLAKMKVPRNLVSPPKLSKRELDCLKLYLKGKSASEIGDGLGLTKRTVEFYINNVKNKLSCYKKSELIELLALMGKLGLYKELFE